LTFHTVTARKPVNSAHLGSRRDSGTAWPDALCAGGRDPTDAATNSACSASARLVDLLREAIPACAHSQINQRPMQHWLPQLFALVKWLTDIY